MSQIQGPFVKFNWYETKENYIEGLMKLKSERFERKRNVRCQELVHALYIVHVQRPVRKID